MYVIIYLFFSTYKSISPISINLPNGNTILAKHSGTIILSEQLHLFDVLYIPDFKFNLISVQKLANSLHCKLIFTPNSCLIQDLPSQRMIGRADVCNGLYILNHPSASHNCDVNSVNSVASTQFDIWHYRLGHPSIPVIHQLCNKFPYIKFNKNLLCDSCYMAKQTRLSFPNSTTMSLKPFDLVHMDIWGPLNIVSFQGYQYFLTIVDDLVDILGYIF